MLHENSGRNVLVTNVYGPSSDEEEKFRFIQELRTLSAMVRDPWILLGDFNLVRWMIDRTGDMRGFDLI